MCGIAGVVNPAPRRFATAELRDLLGRMAHRGPDDRGWLALTPAGVLRGREAEGGMDAHALLLHRRLSILDLSEVGWQPMSTPDGRFHIAYNGEVYNFVELRAELEGLGDTFRGHSDTEVLLAAFARWGHEALPRLEGMFAFAVLDTRDRTLFLARDPFGIKPLYYAEGPGGTAFASEVRVARELAGLPPRAHPQRVFDYLRFGMTEHAPETMFAGVRQLPAGHWLRLRLDAPAPAPAPVRYWTLDGPVREGLSFGQAAEELRHLFLESVRVHLRSDVPVGAALSGGIDSSAVVAAVQHLEPDAELHTFTYVADHARVSDEPWADLMIGRSRVIAHKVRPEAGELVRDLDDLIRIQEEPFGSTGMYAQARVFRLAHEAGIKVTLDGQGADEVFGGYTAFRSARLASLVRQGAWGRAARLARSSAALPGTGMRILLMRSGGLLIPPRLQRLPLAMIGRPLAPQWLQAGWFRDRGVTFRTHWQARGRDVLRERLHRFITEIHLPSLLRYADRNSMAYSVESRVPFLTPALASFAHALPEEHLVAPDGTTKAVLRAALRGLVPDEVLDRRDKIGFATPEREWLATLRPWVETVLRSEAAHALPVFPAGALQAEWERVLAGRAPFDGRIWRWLNLIRWAELNDVQFA